MAASQPTTALIAGVGHQTEPVSDEEHMRATYELLDGIIGEMFVHLTAQMNTLGDQGQAAGQ
jgi:hypothetical protein